MEKTTKGQVDFKNPNSKFKDARAPDISNGRSVKFTHISSGKGAVFIQEQIKGRTHNSILLDKNKPDTGLGKAQKGVDHIRRGVEDVKPEEDDNLSETLDDKTKLFLDRAVDAHLQNAGRYKDVEKVATNTVKAIKRQETATDRFIRSAPKFADHVDEKFCSTDKYMTQTNAQASIKAVSNEPSAKSTATLSVRSSEPGKTTPLKKAGNVPHTSADGANRTAAEGLKKTAKKARKKEQKKAAAAAGVSQMLRHKKELTADLSDVSGQGTGDLIKDGGGGTMRAITGAIKDFISYKVKSMLVKIAPAFLGIVLAGVLVLSPVIIITSSVAGIAAAFAGDEGAEGDYDPNAYLNGLGGDGKMFSDLSDDQINSIIASVIDSYGDDVTPELETMIRYALSKVGCAYNQAYHGNLTVDIFDCSSFAYRAYKQIGIDISTGGAYTAAAEAQGLDKAGKVVTDTLKPGDLVFYGGSDNGRYLGIYHVAIYVGNGKCVEALGTNYGVVYGDLRTKNVVLFCRP